MRPSSRLVGLFLLGAALTSLAAVRVIDDRLDAALVGSDIEREFRILDFVEQRDGSIIRFKARIGTALLGARGESSRPRKPSGTSTASRAFTDDGFLDRGDRGPGPLAKLVEVCVQTCRKSLFAR